jgi:hypothetical protein
LIDALGDEDGPVNKYSWNPIRPNNDRDITPEELVTGKYPELYKPFTDGVFQFIPYGEKEQRYQYISENVRYLIDSELKSLEDYEMFIEDYEESDILSYNGWDYIVEKLGEPQVAYLVKKYVGLGNFADLETQKRFLTPKDREWYLDIILKYDATRILEYCELVKDGGVSEKLIRGIFKEEEDYSHAFLNAIIGFDSDTSNMIWNSLNRYFNRYFNEETFSKILNYWVDFFMGRNVTSELLGALLQNSNPYAVAEVPPKLIEYYSKNNIPIPKSLYKFIISDPNIAYRFYWNWIKTKQTNPPRLLIKTILKNPHTALRMAETLKWNGKSIPDEVEEAILKDPSTAYKYINSNFGNFELYSNDFLVWLFTGNHNGFEFARANNGYGIFEKDYGKKSYEDVRQAILRNIMDNPKKALYILKWADDYERKKSPFFFQLLYDSVENLEDDAYEESFKVSQLDTIIELSKYNK